MSRRAAAVVLSFMLFCVVPGGLMAQQRVIVPATPILEIDDWPAYGSTMCSYQGNPIIVLRRDLTPPLRDHIIQHELVHVAQLKRAGNMTCSDFLDTYQRDPVFRLEQELEAYCSDARSLLATADQPIDVGELRGRLVFIVVQAVQPSDTAAAVSAVNRGCELAPRG